MFAIATHLSEVSFISQTKNIREWGFLEAPHQLISKLRVPDTIEEFTRTIKSAVVFALYMFRSQRDSNYNSDRGMSYMKI